MQKDIELRIEAIESRLKSMETLLSSFMQPGSATKANPAPASSVSPSTEPEVPLHLRSAPIHTTRTTPSVPQEQSSGNWLGIVAVICFVLAAGLIIKLAIDSGWLTPARQIGIAALLGFGLIGSGFAFLRSDREYASLLPAAGVIVLYLTAFAAHRVYSLISFEVAIACVALVSAMCIGLYRELKYDIYAVIAAVGAYLSPTVLNLNTDAVFSIYYFLICSAAFALISVWVESRLLTLISAYLAIILTSLIGLQLNQDILVAAILALHFLIFAAGAYTYTMHHHKPLSETEAWSFLPVLFIFYAMEYMYIDRINALLAPWISLGFAGVLIGLYISAKNKFPDSLASQSLILAFATLVGFHSVYMELLPDAIRPWLFVLIISGYALLGNQVDARECPKPFKIPMYAIGAILLIEYLKIVVGLLDDRAHIGVAMAAFASLWLLIFTKPPLTHQHRNANVLLASAHILAILGFYQLTHDIGSLAVSASWLFYGAAVIVFAFKRQDEVMARSAIFVLTFAAGKALLYDAASAPTIIRILCLLLTGAVLYGCGLMMRKFSKWGNV